MWVELRFAKLPGEGDGDVASCVAIGSFKLLGDVASSIVIGSSKST